MSRVYLLGLILFSLSCSVSPKKVLKPLESIPSKKTVVPISTLREVKIDPKAPKYIVQNLATLILRVYQIPCPTCVHELIFEAPMVVGKNLSGFKTKVGFYKISGWHQFHEDYEGKYLAWFKSPPPSGSPRSAWKNIGAFGWYTAILEPSASGQWLHGTIGWADEGGSFIQPSLSPSGGLIRVKSKGCTRISNPDIAFLKTVVPTGSWVFRIYAPEVLTGPEEDLLVNWSHILLHEQSPLDGGNWSKTFKLQAYPVAEPELRSLGLISNPYEIPLSSLSGVFLVKEGKINNYHHPQKLPVGGLLTPPSFFTFKNNEISP